jgi:Cu-Zn family superoxide dismutase
VDPAAGPGRPSTDPAYANPRNEVWLDLRTDGTGSGTATAEVPFAVGERAPASVVVHEAQATATDPGRAGTAGARLACLTVPFT